MQISAKPRGEISNWFMWLSTVIYKNWRHGNEGSSAWAESAYTQDVVTEAQSTFKDKERLNQAEDCFLTHFREMFMNSKIKHWHRSTLV